MVVSHHYLLPFFSILSANSVNLRFEWAGSGSGWAKSSAVAFPAGKFLHNPVPIIPRKFPTQLGHPDSGKPPLEIQRIESRLGSDSLELEKGGRPEIYARFGGDCGAESSSLDR